MHEKEEYLLELEDWARQLSGTWAELSGNGTLVMTEKTASVRSSLDQLMAELNFNRGKAVDDMEILRLGRVAEELYQAWGRMDFSDASFAREPEWTRDVPIGGHQLPPLPYTYNALEPFIDRRIMMLHHDKHHKSYVDGLNRAEREMAQARKTGDFALIKHWEREAAFHGAGHYLHSIFWKTMAPKGAQSGGRPKGDLLVEIEQSFGGFKDFKNHFSAAAQAVEGSGWAILVWVPSTRRLEILQAEKHQNLSQWDVVPLLPLDVWEHAYYLQYENNRGKYIDNWWNVVNWDEVARRLAQVKR